MEVPNNEPVPVLPPDAVNVPLLSDADTLALTEARTDRWQVQQYEFAYDWEVRRLSHIQTWVEFLHVLIAVLFIYLHAFASDSNNELQHNLGMIGTGLALLVILAAIWASMNHWKWRIQQMRSLSVEAARLLREYQKLVVIRPVDHARILQWRMEVLALEEKRKDPLAAPSALAMKRGFQHVGNKNIGRGVVCSICSCEWVPASNAKARWSWFPLYGCSNCGVSNK